LQLILNINRTILRLSHVTLRELDQPIGITHPIDPEVIATVGGSEEQPIPQILLNSTHGIP
jgi:hypothetical protein